MGGDDDDEDGDAADDAGEDAVDSSEAAASAGAGECLLHVVWCAKNMERCLFVKFVG